MSGTQFIVWQDEYSVGNELLDNQHKKIFWIINALYEEQQGRSNEGEIRELLEAAKVYAVEHFRLEEKFMRECDYPDTLPHQRSHAIYEAKIKDLFTLGSELSIMDELLPYLKTWWKKHVVEMDRAYAPFLKKA